MSTENVDRVLKVGSDWGVDETLDAMFRSIGAPYGFSYSDALGIPQNTLKTWRRRGKVPLPALRRFAHDNELRLMCSGNDKPIEAAEQLQPDAGCVLIRERAVKTVNDLPGLNFIAATPAFLMSIGAVGAHLGMVMMQGSSMSPTIEHGDQVLVNFDLSGGVGDDVFLIEHAGSEKIKRIQRRADGGITISSDNPSFAPERLSAGEAGSISLVARVLPYKFGRFAL